MSILIRWRNCLLCLLLLVGSTTAKAERQNLTLATDNWQPYYSEQQAQQGPISEIAKRAFEQAGYKLEIKFVPWKRALEQAKVGFYDGVLGAFKNQERQQFFWYSDPVAVSRLVFFAHLDSQICFQQLKDLYGQSIGIINAYFYTEEFEQAADLKKVKANQLSQNFRRLLERRLDLVLAEQQVGWSLLQQGFPEQKKTINDTQATIKRKPLVYLNF